MTKPRVAQRLTFLLVVIFVASAILLPVIARDPATFFLVGLHGLTFACLLFVVASGFTLIFGVMGITNLAHGSLYLLGGYIGYSIASISENWLLALAGGAIAAGICGLAVQQILLRHVQGDEMREALLTLGLSIVIADQLLAFYGGFPRDIAIPDSLVGAIGLGGIGLVYPTFRLFVVIIAIAVGISIFLLLKRTRLGIAIRAGVDDREMLAATGVNVAMVFLFVFMLGSSLAGLSGVIGGSFLSLAPGEDGRILLYSLVVVVIGGMRSVAGAALGALLVGVTSQYAAVYAPTYAALITFGMMVLVLAIRPSGLLGR